MALYAIEHEIDEYLERAEASEVREERIDELAAQYAADPAMVAEADEWIRGEQSESHYDALESAMADLADTEPADLLGSEVLERLYRLARVHGATRRQQLREMAEEAISREEYEAEQAQAEQLANARAAA